MGTGAAPEHSKGERVEETQPDTPDSSGFSGKVPMSSPQLGWHSPMVKDAASVIVVNSSAAGYICRELWLIVF